MTTAPDRTPVILRREFDGQPQFVIVPFTDIPEWCLLFATWDALCEWVEMLAVQVVPVADPVAELESYDTWLAARG